MTAHTGLGARTPGEAIAGSQLVQAIRPDQGADDDATTARSRLPQKDSNVLERLLQNLMLALGAWHV